VGGPAAQGVRLTFAAGGFDALSLAGLPASGPVGNACGGQGFALAVLVPAAAAVAAHLDRHCAALQQVRPIAEDEMFKVMRSGKRQKKQWKRMLTKVTFVGGAFTRKPPKYERFIRPTGAMDPVVGAALVS